MKLVKFEEASYRFQKFINNFTIAEAFEVTEALVYSQNLVVRLKLVLMREESSYNC